MPTTHTSQDDSGSEDLEPSDNFDDSDQEDEDSDVFEVPDKVASPDVIQKALKTAQITITELRVELRKSKKENATLSENQPKRKLKNIPAEVSKHDRDIMMLGRRYSIMICPWVDTTVFRQLGRPQVDPLSPDRYKNAVSKRDGNIAEMYDFVPKKLHKLMEKHTHFGDLFKTYANAMRSTATHTVREKAPAIFDIPDSIISVKVNRGNVQELQSLITKNGEYVQFPRILYPNDNMRKPDLFRNDCLVKTLKVIFFGPSSLHSGQVPKPKTNAQIWKVTEVTAGAIAFAAILARFMLSPDTEFSPKGSVTQIDYLGDFNLYKRMLLTDTPNTRALFEWYNRHIFARNENVQQPQSAGRSDDNEEDFRELMRAFTNIQVADKVDRISEIAPPGRASETPKSPAADEPPTEEGPANAPNATAANITAPVSTASKGTRRRSADEEEAASTGANKRQARPRKKA